MKQNKQYYIHFFNLITFAWCVIGAFNLYPMEEPRTTDLPQQISVQLTDEQGNVITHNTLTVEQYEPFSTLKNLASFSSEEKISIPISTNNISQEVWKFIYKNIQYIIQNDQNALEQAFKNLKKQWPTLDLLINNIQEAGDYLGNDSLVTMCHNILLQRAEEYYKKNPDYINKLSEISTRTSFLTNPTDFINNLVKERTILSIDEYMTTLIRSILQKNMLDLQWKEIKRTNLNIVSAVYSPDKTLVALLSKNPSKITILKLPHYTEYKEFPMEEAIVSAVFSNDNAKLYIGGRNILSEIDIESGKMSGFNVPYEQFTATSFHVPHKQFTARRLRLSPDNKYLGVMFIRAIGLSEMNNPFIFNTENKNNIFENQPHNLKIFQNYTSDGFLFYSNNEVIGLWSTSILTTLQPSIKYYIIKFNFTTQEANSIMELGNVRLDFEVSPEKNVIISYQKIHTSQVEMWLTIPPSLPSLLRKVTLQDKLILWKFYMFEQAELFSMQMPDAPYKFLIHKYKGMNEVPDHSIQRNQSPGLINTLFLDNKERIHVIFNNGSIKMYDPNIALSLEQALFSHAIIKHRQENEKPLFLPIYSESYTIWETFNPEQQEQLKPYVIIEGEVVQGPPTKKQKFEEEPPRGPEGKEEI